MIISTDRLIIRTPSLEDATAINKGIADSYTELKQWMWWAQNLPLLSKTRSNLEAAIHSIENRGSEMRLVIFSKDEKFVGSSGLHAIDWNIPKCEIGYWLSTDQTGYGYATEAIRAISEYAKHELCMKRVEILVSAKNIKSRRIPERLNIPLEARLKNHRINPDGLIDDTCIYSWTAEIGP